MPGAERYTFRVYLVSQRAQSKELLGKGGSPLNRWAASPILGSRI